MLRKPDYEQRPVEVPLTHGMVAIIDESDASEVSHFRWHTHHGRHTPYAIGELFVPQRSARYIRLRIPMHRLIMNPGAGRVVDHINGDGLDNRRQNLRIATVAENAANRRTVSGGSKFKGVSWYARHQKWQAKITCNYKQYGLGFFVSEVEAALAYDRAARELHGTFAALNFPGDRQ